MRDYVPEVGGEAVFDVAVGEFVEDNVLVGGVASGSERDDAGVIADVGWGAVEDLGGMEEGSEPGEYGCGCVHDFDLSCKATVIFC